MLPDRLSNPGPLTYELGVLPIALRGPANAASYCFSCYHLNKHEEQSDLCLIPRNLGITTSVSYII